MVRGSGGERRCARSAAIGGAPSWLGHSANSGFLGVGRAGGLRRGRREYVLVGSVAPSMALTPLRSPPARPRTGSCALSHERQNKKSKAEAGRFALQCLISDVPWLPASGRHYRRASTHGVDLPQVAETCRRRGGSGGGAVRGMDAAAKPPGTGLRRPPPPDPPRHPTGTPLLLWQLLLPLLLPLPWLRRVPGAARPEPFPRFRYNVGPVSQLRFPGHDGPRGRARPVAVPPRTS